MNMDYPHRTGRDVVRLVDRFGRYRTRKPVWTPDTKLCGAARRALDARHYDPPPRRQGGVAAMDKLRQGSDEARKHEGGTVDFHKNFQALIWNRF